MSKQKHTTTPSATPRRARAAKPAKPAPPWIEGGIDYGPAILAIDELTSWAFDLAAASVDSAADRRRVKRARRVVGASLRGKATPTTVQSEADVMFAASLLIRIFDADLGLGLSEIVAVLAELGLPIGDVPRSPSPGGVRVAPPTPSTIGLRPLTTAAQVRVVPLHRSPIVRAPVTCGACGLPRTGVALAA